MHGNTYQDLLKHARVHELENGVQILYLGMEGLIKLKQFSLRPKDQLDVQVLKEMMGDSSPKLPLVKTSGWLKIWKQVIGFWKNG